MNQPKYLMTKHGYKKLEQKLERLEQELIEAGLRAGEAAGIDSDWHDNPAYEYAVEEANHINYQIQMVKHKLANAKIVEVARSTDVVEIGVRVVVAIDGKQEEFTIGGEGEGDPFSGVVSHNSPVGTAILGHKVGNTVSMDAGGEKVSVEILEIRAESPE